MFSTNSQTPHNRETNKKLVKIIHSLLNADESVPFRKPVPHKALGLGDYKNVVKKPVDLNLVRRQNNDGRYKIIEEALDDIQLCWDNCKIYNHPNSEIYEQASVLETKFRQMVSENFPGVHERAVNNDSLPPFHGVMHDSSPISAEKRFPHDELPSMELKEQTSKKSENWSRKKYSNRKSVDIDFESINKKNSQMQPEEDGEESPNFVNQFDKQSQKSDAKEPLKDPIIVNLYECPSLASLQQLNRRIQSEESKEILEEVLEILYTYERQNLIKSKNGEMCFKMQKIHLTTFYRLCKVLKFQPQEPLEIIE